MKTGQRKTPPHSSLPHDVSRTDMGVDPDAALLRRMADGEEAALGALYDKWVERLHTVAFWILQDADEAEDVVEETFWQAWRNADRYDRVRSSGSTWLMLIARSRALDRLRARRRREDWTARAGALADPFTDEASPAGESAETDERHARLNDALGVLPAEQRRVLELAFFGGLSHSEIAAKTAQPLGTIKTRIRLALDKLRQRLAHLREQGP